MLRVCVLRYYGLHLMCICTYGARLPLPQKLMRHTPPGREACSGFTKHQAGQPERANDYLLPRCPLPRGPPDRPLPRLSPPNRPPLPRPSALALLPDLPPPSLLSPRPPPRPRSPLPRPPPRPRPRKPPRLPPPPPPPPLCVLPRVKFSSGSSPTCSREHQVTRSQRSQRVLASLTCAQPGKGRTR